MAKIVGRKKEQQQLEHLLDSKEVSFLSSMEDVE